MKLLLALLALLTGFAVADGVHMGEPPVEQGEGAGWSAAILADDGAIAARAADYLVAILLPLIAAIGLILFWVAKPAPRLVAATIHPADRLRQ